MATLSTFSSLPSTLPLHSHKPFTPSSLTFKTHLSLSTSFNKNNTFFISNNNATNFNNSYFHGFRRVKSVEEESQVSEEEVTEEVDQTQTVSVPVSPSDTLTMYFEAEGTMTDSAIPNVTKALEQTEGITDLKVRIDEGIASVGLKKQTTVQATGVASSLVELIQGSGFKLQTLNLSFEDEEDLVAA